jgi:hypothetical protein
MMPKHRMTSSAGSPPFCATATHTRTHTHAWALLSRPQPRAAVAAWPSSAPCCRSTPAPTQLLLGGGASRWRPGSRGRSAASPLFRTHDRFPIAGFLSLSLKHAWALKPRLSTRQGPTLAPGSQDDKAGLIVGCSSARCLKHSLPCALPARASGSPAWAAACRWAPAPPRLRRLAPRLRPLGRGPARGGARPALAAPCWGPPAPERRRGRAGEERVEDLRRTGALKSKHVRGGGRPLAPPRPLQRQAAPQDTTGQGFERSALRRMQTPGGARLVGLARVLFEPVAHNAQPRERQDVRDTLLAVAQPAHALLKHPKLAVQLCDAAQTQHRHPGDVVVSFPAWVVRRTAASRRGAHTQPGPLTGRRAVCELCCTPTSIRKASLHSMLLQKMPRTHLAGRRRGRSCGCAPTRPPRRRPACRRHPTSLPAPRRSLSRGALRGTTRQRSVLQLLRGSVTATRHPYDGHVLAAPTSLRHTLHCPVPCALSDGPCATMQGLTHLAAPRRPSRRMERAAAQMRSAVTAAPRLRRYLAPSALEVPPGRPSLTRLRTAKCQDRKPRARSQACVTASREGQHVRCCLLRQQQGPAAKRHAPGGYTQSVARLQKCTPSKSE